MDKMAMIMCWKAENGELYSDRDKALKNSPKGKIKEIWGDGSVDCKDPEHSKECRGPGDVENHIFPYLRKRSIPELMGRILSCCGDDLSSVKSCGCTHSAIVLMEMLGSVVDLPIWRVEGWGKHAQIDLCGFYFDKQTAESKAEELNKKGDYCYGVKVLPAVIE